jgi:hypothetical protein
MWCAAETVARACERTGFEIHSHVGNAPMEQLSGVCAVPAYRPPDGQGKKGLKEQDDDMFGLTPNFPSEQEWQPQDSKIGCTCRCRNGLRTQSVAY